MGWSMGRRTDGEQEKKRRKKRSLGTSYLPPLGEIYPELALLRDLGVRIA